MEYWPGCTEGGTDFTCIMGRSTLERKCTVNQSSIMTAHIALYKRSIIIQVSIIIQISITKTKRAL